MVHVRDIFGEFEDRGVKVLGVTADDPEQLRKYLTFHEMPFSVLNDDDKEVITRYGLTDNVGPPRGIVTHPAYLILDPLGVIRYLYLSDRNSDMPEDDELFGKLDSINEPSRHTETGRDRWPLNRTL